MTSRVVGATAAVVAALATLFMGTAAGGGGGCYEGATQGRGTTVRLEHACFTPTILRVAPGTTVRFANLDGMTHALSGVDMGYAELVPGASVEHTFRAAGVYPYMCHIHPGMTGAVVVGDGLGTAQLTDAAPVVPPPTSIATQPVAAKTAERTSSWPVLVVGLAAAVAGFAAGWLLRRRTRSSA